jgi:3-methyladenine DNA glycosylase AlkD
LSSQPQQSDRLKEQKIQALAEVTERTRSKARATTAASPGNHFRRFSIRVPVIRALVKEGYNFLDLPHKDIVRIWDHIWKNTQWYEVAHQALYYYQHKTITKAEFLKIKSWVSRCDCWEHSDDLSKIFAQVVEDNPAWILPTFEKWNRSKHPWKRRQSVVGLIEYASKRKSVLSFPDLIKFVDPLLDDEDYYVQKGVGWTLREIHNLYPLDALGYIQAKVLLLHPLAYSSATEKLDKVNKEKLNFRRKQHRSV